MEHIQSFIESANKYGLPLPLILLLLGLYFWASTRVSWVEREKFYYELLGALGKWKDSLVDRKDYYFEPGSEYRDDSITVKPRYILLRETGGEARAIIRDQLHVGKLYLSQNTVVLIEEMLGEHWVIGEVSAICESDYLDETLIIVKNAYNLVLADAKVDLKKSRYLKLLNILLGK